MPATPSPNSDELLLEYLDTLDTYQSQIQRLTTELSEGYIALAQAAFHSGRTYGRDCYDERMSAMRGVDVGNNGGFTVRSIAVQEEGEVVGGVREKDEEESTVRRRKVTEEKETVAVPTSEDSKPTTIDPRDPLRWFGILHPASLRATQSSFVAALAPACALASTQHTLRGLSQRLFAYKILTSPPPTSLPDVLPLSPLDADSGYIHMCTADQVTTVIGRFMKSATELWLLRVPLGVLGDSLRWEEADGELFPHFYGDFGKKQVGGMAKVEKGEEGWSNVVDGAAWQIIEK